MSAGKFEQNRNKFRRVYSYGARPRPNIQTYFDPGIVATHQRDFNQIQRFRDYFKIGDRTLFSPPGEYAENLFPLVVGQTSFTVNFSPSTFSATPIVTLAVDSVSASAFGNINFFLTAVSQTSFTFGLSAPAISTASIHWKAINVNPSFGSFAAYPVVVQRYPLFSGVFVTASAESITVGGVASVTMSFGDLGTIPSDTSITPLDNGNFQADVYVTQSFVGTGGANVDLSAPLTGFVNLIALK